MRNTIYQAWTIAAHFPIWFIRMRNICLFTLESTFFISFVKCVLWFELKPEQTRTHAHIAAHTHSINISRHSISFSYGIAYLPSIVGLKHVSYSKKCSVFVLLLMYARVAGRCGARVSKSKRERERDSQRLYSVTEIVDYLIKKETSPGRQSANVVI